MTTNADLLREARDRFKEAEDLWAENRKLWLEDAQFRAGNQWPEKLKKQREEADRPALVVDKTEQYVRQVVNDGRQNRPEPRVSPVDDKADVKVAQAFKGHIRSICNKSNADEAFDTALDHAAGCGFGFFRVLTEHEHAKTFNQEIVVRRVRNPMAVLLGPHQQADGSDAEYGFIFTDIPKTAYKRQFPKAKAVNWEDGGYKDGWSGDKTVRIAEYFYKVEEPSKLLELTDGTVVTEEEYLRDVRQVAPADPAMADPAADYKPGIERERMVPITKVKWCKLSGAEVLDKKDWPGIYIPIIPVYGVEQDINGKVTYRGLIRPAKDPQRLYNFARSGFAEHVSLSTKQPFIAAAGQLEGFEDEWQAANTENIPVLHYNPADVDGKLVPRPERAMSAGIPTGLAQDMQISEHDIQGAVGMYDAALGARSNEKSGVAIEARDRQSDVGTFHYHDNLNRAIRYLCRQLVDLIPKVYDSRRTVRLLAEDGKATMAVFDPTIATPTEKRGELMVYNMGVGIYDVEMVAGPSYTTKRQEAAEGMLAMTQANPTMWQTHGDLIVKAQDWPGADEFATRSKLALPPELRSAVEASEGDGDPEVRTLQAQLAQTTQMAQQAVAEREELLAQQAKELEAAKAKNEAAIVQAETQRYAAETERQRLEWEMSKPPEVAQDNTELELARLAKEDEWKRLDAETKVICTYIQASSKGTDMDPTTGEPVEGGEEVADVDPTFVIAQAMDSFNQALSGVQSKLEEMAVANEDDSDAPIRFGRDGSGQINSFTRGGKTIPVSFGRDGDGRINSVTKGNRIFRVLRDANGITGVQ